MTQVDQILTKLNKRGYRTTNIKKATLEIICQAKTPIAVHEIKENLAMKDFRPNKTTLYRELAALVKEGVVEELEFGDRKKGMNWGEMIITIIWCVDPVI